MAKTSINNWAIYGLEEFLTSRPSIRLEEISDSKLILEGEYKFTSTHADNELDISDSYEIRIEFHLGYPKIVPTVFELDGRIPKNISNHIYSNDSFCLGSPIRLKKILQQSSGIHDFFENIVMPFLYSYSYKEKHGNYPYGELAHYGKGLIDDYEQIFDVKGKRAVMLVLKALGSNTMTAHRLSCPCGCKRTIGKCEFKHKIKEWRSLDQRRWYRKHWKELSRNQF